MEQIYSACEKDLNFIWWGGGGRAEVQGWNSVV